MITVNNVQYLNFTCEHQKQQFSQAEEGSLSCLSEL